MGANELAQNIEQPARIRGQAALLLFIDYFLCLRLLNFLFLVS